MAQADAMPMAETYKDMMEKRHSSLVIVIPGVALMALAVLIVVWPSMSPWLVAIACILAGSAMLQTAYFMRRVGAWLERTGG